jgi:hypothetical protein
VAGYDIELNVIVKMKYAKRWMRKNTKWLNEFMTEKK